jgi:streptogramin lyase
MSPRRFRLVASLAGVAALALGTTQSASALTPTVTEHAVTTASSQPRGVAAGPDGALWFAESGANSIGRMATSGIVTNEYTLPNPSSDPEGITTGPDGNLWFTEGTGNRIGRITPAGVISEYPVPTLSSGALSIAAGPDGNLWFTESSAGQVGRITPAGAITEFPLTSSTTGPEGITAAAGALWLVEQGTNQIARVTTAGVVTNEFLIPATGSGAADIALGSDGNLWFTETSAGQIGRITLAGAVSEYALPTPGAGPLGLTPGTDGALWFTETTPGAIGRIATDGSASEYPLAPPTATPQDIAIGPDGNLWFTEPAGNQVGQLTTPPAAVTGGASAVQVGGATLAGVANARTQTTSSHFEYGPSAAYGMTTGAQALAPIAADQDLSTVLSRLAAGSTYHYRLVVQNGTGMAFGADQTFTTLPVPPASPARAPVSPTPLSRGVPILSPPLLSVTNTPPAVTISGAAITVTRGRVAPVVVKCPVTALSGCHGTVSIALAKGPASAGGSRTRAVIARCARGCRALGQSKLSASRGQSKRVPVKLSRYAFHLLALHRTLSVRVTVATVIGGHMRSQSRVVVMHAPSRA